MSDIKLYLLNCVKESGGIAHESFRGVFIHRCTASGLVDVSPFNREYEYQGWCCRKEQVIPLLSGRE